MGLFKDSMLRVAGSEEEIKHARKEELVDKFVKPQLERYEGCSKQVLQFIAGVRYHQWLAGEEAIETLFLGGYCYYFAVMLKEAFQRGVVCCNGRSHIVWLDGTDVSKDVAYDICGVYQDYELLIPVKAMGYTIMDFMHVPGLVHNTTEAEVADLTSMFKDVTDLRRYV